MGDKPPKPVKKQKSDLPPELQPNEQKVAKASGKTGNCFAGRHHTCPGWGKSREAKAIRVYVCSCPCGHPNARPDPERKLKL